MRNSHYYFNFHCFSQKCFGVPFQVLQTFPQSVLKIVLLLLSLSEDFEIKLNYAYIRCLTGLLGVIGWADRGSAELKFFHKHNDSGVSVKTKISDSEKRGH